MVPRSLPAHLQPLRSRLFSYGPSAHTGTQANTVSYQLLEQTYETRNACQLHRRFTLKPSLHQLLPPPSRVTYPSLLRFCTNEKLLASGELIHEHIVINGYDKDIFVCNLLLQMYCDCGSMKDARKLFAMMQRRDLFSWNCMIKSYSRLGSAERALKLFEQMIMEALLPDPFVMANVLSACASSMDIYVGKRLHACSVGGRVWSDFVLGTALINLYGKCAFTDEAQDVFDSMEQRDVVSWTAIIDAYLQVGAVKKALQLYTEMRKNGVSPDKYTAVKVLKACTDCYAIDEGRKMHDQLKEDGYESDTVIGNALLNMYGKSKKMSDAEDVFVKIIEKDVISWNVMIVTYERNGHGEKALQLFEQMQKVGPKPDAMTYESVFRICASLGQVGKGKEIHLSILGTELESDNVLSATIIFMYGEVGCIVDAQKLFNKSSKQNVDIWNAYLAALAHNGRGTEAIQNFQQMQSELVIPDKSTYASLLLACAKSGLVEEGSGYFESMTRDYGISPSLEHYNCLIYMLGRTKKLKEAVEIIGKMPFEPNLDTWLTLLTACKNHVDVKRGERVAKHLFQVVPKNVETYLLLLELYLAGGREKDAADILNLIKSLNCFTKSLQCSTIEVRDQLHTFSGDDPVLPQKEHIYNALMNIERLSKEAGITQSYQTLLDELEGKFHSEKIAVAFGLISTVPKSQLHITKRLNTCKNCHEVIKLISRVYDREILLRDASCLHFISGGVCSCTDYW